MCIAGMIPHVKGYRSVDTRPGIRPGPAPGTLGYDNRATSRRPGFGVDVGDGHGSIAAANGPAPQEGSEL